MYNIHAVQAICSKQLYYRWIVFILRFFLGPQTTYIPIPVTCLSPCPNWDPPPPLLQASAFPPPLPPGTKGRGTHSPTVEGLGGPNSDDWRKSLSLCLLCGLYIFTLYCTDWQKTMPVLNILYLLRKTKGFFKLLTLNQSSSIAL
jgi:hypothetical protein